MLLINKLKIIKYLFLISIFFLFRISYSNDPDSLAGTGIEDIVIMGNDKTRPKIILREMKSHIGDPYSPDMLDKDIKRIESLRLFSRVQYDVFSSGTDSVIIIITVSERWYIFPIPLLLRNEKSWDKWSYGLGLLHDNVHGLNHDIIASGWLGFNPGFDIEYKIPWFADSMDLFAGINVYYLKIKSQNLNPNNDYNRYDFDEQHRGIKGYVGKRWGYHFYTSFMYSFNHLRYPDHYQHLFSDPGAQNTLSFGLDFRWDTRDLIQYPTSGCYLDAYVSSTPWEQVRYTFVGTDMRTYLGWRDVTFAFRFAGIKSFGTIPIFAHTFLGYEERVRGYFTKQYEGENRTLASAELRFPIIPVRYISLKESEEYLGHYSKDLPLGLNGSLFYDTGSVWMQNEHLSFLSGFGIGLNARVPYAEVIRFEYAWNTDWQSEWIIDLGVTF